jgi:hypothetical protein
MLTEASVALLVWFIVLSRTKKMFTKLPAEKREFPLLLLAAAGVGRPREL